MSDETPGGLDMWKTGQEVLASLHVNPWTPSATLLSGDVKFRILAGSDVPDPPSDAQRASGEQDVADFYNDVMETAFVNMVAERDAERARADAAEAWARDVDLKNSMLHLVENERVDVANALKKALAELECVNSDARAQIVRLMAERDEAQAERNELREGNLLLIDRLSKFVAAEPKQEPELAHNPFRSDFGGDRRRVGS